MTKLPISRRQRARAIIAYHEAGHAVIARALGVTVEFVAMNSISEDAAAGAMTRSAAHHADKADTAARIRGSEADAMVALAGWAAQSRVHASSAERWVNDPADGDVRNALSNAGRIAMLQAGEPVPDLAPGEAWELPAAYRESAVANYKRLWTETNAMVAEHWRKIERLAKILIERDYVDGAELDQLIA